MKIKILVTLLIIFALNGCGGGGETPNQITDNSYNDTYTPTPTQQDDYNYTYVEPKPKEYDLSKLNGVESHLKYTGSGITIGIVDVGFDLNNSELANIEIMNRDDYSNPINTSSDDINHGTEMTQIIGADGSALINGITKGSTIIVGNSSNPSTYYKEMNTFGASVISNSWGVISKYNHYLGDNTNNVILDLSVNGNNGKGIVFVFSMGNNNEDIEEFHNHWRYITSEYNATNNTFNNNSMDDNILLVGSLDGYDKKKSYSNYGSSADVFVPDDVYVNENNTLKIFQGTSSATAIVSSIVAMAQEARGDLNSSVIMNLICKTATQIGDTPYDVKDINGNMRSKVFGCGKVDVDAFITAVERF